MARLAGRLGAPSPEWADRVGERRVSGRDLRAVWRYFFHAVQAAQLRTLLLKQVQVCLASRFRNRRRGPGLRILWRDIPNQQVQQDSNLRKIVWLTYPVGQPPGSLNPYTTCQSPENPSSSLTASLSTTATVFAIPSTPVSASGFTLSRGPLHEYDRRAFCVASEADGPRV